MRVLCDATGEVIRRYGLLHKEEGPVRGRAIARPGTIILGGDGRVVWTFVPTNFRLRPDAREVVDRLRGETRAS